MKKLELKKLIKEAVKLHLEELETNERKNVSKRAGVFCKCGGDPIFFCPYGSCSHPRCSCSEEGVPPIAVKRGEINEEEQLNEEWSAEQCSRSWDKVTDMGGDPQGMSIFRKFCCRRGWKCCTRKRPKRNPCWD